MEELYKYRAKALAEILYYDLVNYHDINLTTIKEAWRLASEKFEQDQKEEDNGE
jgi:hypothetical protein